MTFTDGAYTFSGNSASGAGDSSGRGGAVSGDSSVSFTDGTYTFSGNTATGGAGEYSGWGGAVYGGYVTFTNGTYTFSGNSANGGAGEYSGRGGAIYAQDPLELRGSAVFAGNSATTSSSSAPHSGQGGAIYANNIATLIADGGDIIFMGNTHGLGGSEQPNAIFAADDLTLTALEGHAVRLLDPIAGTSGEIHINKLGSGANTGLVVFDGSRHVGGMENTKQARTTVHGGELRLKDGVGYGHASETFTLNSGAILAVYGKGNELKASSTMNLDTLAFSLDGADTSTAILTTNAPVDIMTGGTVDIRSLGVITTPGLPYRLIQSSSTSFFGAPTLTLRGEPVSGTRANGMSLAASSSDLSLYSIPKTGVVRWEGANGETWDATTQNWDTQNVELDTSKRFLHGDAAIFTEVIPQDEHTITIQDRGVAVAGHNATAPGVTITRGNWIFQGGELEGGDILINGGASLTLEARQTPSGFADRYMDQSVTADIALGPVTFAGPSGTDSPALVFAGKRGSSGGSAILGQGTGDLTLAGSMRFLDNAASGTNANEGKGGAVYAGGGLTFKDGRYTFTGNKARGGAGDYSSYGGAVYAGGNLTFESGTYTFAHNEAGGSGSGSSKGGALYANSGLTFKDGTYTFRGNSATGGAGIASGYGGAVYANAATFGRGTYMFADNMAYGQGESSGHGGAMYAGGSLTFNDGGYTFTGNRATGGAGSSSGLGGAAFTNGSMTFESGTYSFADNEARGFGSDSGHGGALYANGDLTFKGGRYTFTGNSANGGAVASGRGGAIYAGQLRILGGDFEFRNNTATQAGGAIYIHSDAAHALVASTGNILFQGTAGGRANALEVRTGTLDIAAASGKTVAFNDPISGGTGAGLTVHLNRKGAESNGGSNTVYDGSIVFSSHQSSILAQTTLHGGEVTFRKGAQYGFDHLNGSFTQLNGSLVADSSGNMIGAKTIALKGGKLVMDMAGAVAREGGSPTVNLRLESAAPVILAGNRAVTVKNTPGKNGSFWLISHGSGYQDGTFFLDSSPVNARYGTMTLHSDHGNTWLTIDGADASRSVTWNGGSGAKWDL